MKHSIISDSELTEFELFIILVCIYCFNLIVIAPPLRAILRVILPTLNLFNTLHTVCFMYGLSINGIKRICQHAQFFHNLTWKFTAFYKLSDKTLKSLILS